MLSHSPPHRPPASLIGPAPPPPGPAPLARINKQPRTSTETNFLRTIPLLFRPAQADVSPPPPLPPPPPPPPPDRISSLIRPGRFFLALCTLPPREEGTPPYHRGELKNRLKNDDAARSPPPPPPPAAPLPPAPAPPPPPAPRPTPPPPPPARQGPVRPGEEGGHRPLAREPQGLQPVRRDDAGQRRHARHAEPRRDRDGPGVGRHVLHLGRRRQDAAERQARAAAAGPAGPADVLRRAGEGGERRAREEVHRLRREPEIQAEGIVKQFNWYPGSTRST
jgi:hypothetical protein